MIPAFKNKTNKNKLSVQHMEHLPLCVWEVSVDLEGNILWIYLCYWDTQSVGAVTVVGLSCQVKQMFVLHRVDKVAQCSSLGFFFNRFSHIKTCKFRLTQPEILDWNPSLSLFCITLLVISNCFFFCLFWGNGCRVSLVHKISKCVCVCVFSSLYFWMLLCLL